MPQFVANYGYGRLWPLARTATLRRHPAGKPFVACTTCHNQHVMTVYTASSKPDRGDGGGKFYATMFFVNAPYNPNLA
jgi:hypothetical protein